MPIRCHVDPAQRLGTAVLDGRIDVEAFTAAMRALYEHPEWEAGFAALWDGTGITQLLIAPDDLAEIDRTYRDVEPRMGYGRGAFVMPREVAQIIAKLLMRRLANPQRERRLFDRVDEALLWLREASGAGTDAA